MTANKVWLLEKDRAVHGRISAQAGGYLQRPEDGLGSKVHATGKRSKESKGDHRKRQAQQTNALSRSEGNRRAARATIGCRRWGRLRQ